MPIYQLVLVSQKTVARQTIEYIFEKPSHFLFKPGQYGGFTLVDSDTNTPVTRRFSLLSAPFEPVIRMTTRIQSSPFKKALLALQPGETIKFAGPAGAFVLNDDIETPAVLIAGGIGITPFYSMIQDNQHLNLKRPLVLFYGNNTLEDAAYLDEFTDFARQNPSFSFIPILQNPPEHWLGEKGIITASLIDNYFDCSQSAIFYVCGSPRMVQATQQMLAEIGIPPERIIIEDFPGY